MGGSEGTEDGSERNMKGAKGRGPQKLVHTPMSEILKIP